MMPWEGRHRRDGTENVRWDADVKAALDRANLTSLRKIKAELRWLIVKLVVIGFILLAIAAFMVDQMMPSHPISGWAREAWATIVSATKARPKLPPDVPLPPPPTYEYRRAP